MKYSNAPEKEIKTAAQSAIRWSDKRVIQALDVLEEALRGVGLYAATKVIGHAKTLHMKRPMTPEEQAVASKNVKPCAV